MIKKILISILFLALTMQICIAKDREYIGLHKLAPEANAYLHNNKGLSYLEIGQYSAAIKEFQIAIALNPDTQATALYYNNLGETYMKLNGFSLAQNCFEQSIKLAPLHFKYYENLVISYKKQGIVSAKLKEKLKDKKSPLDDITIGLLYIANGDYDMGIIILDNFIMNEPKLYITDGVKYYLKELIKKRELGIQ